MYFQLNRQHANITLLIRSEQTHQATQSESIGAVMLEKPQSLKQLPFQAETIDYEYCLLVFSEWNLKGDNYD